MSELKAHVALINGLAPTPCQLAYLKSEADKVIAEKDAEIAKLKENQRWRKFPDEKPEEKQWILVYYGYETNGCRIELRRWDNGCKYDVEFQELYTHWMPMPSAPKED